MPGTSARTEASIERAARRVARDRGVWVLKSEPMFAGFPDSLLLAPGGVVLFVEFKTATGTLSPAQVEVHSLLARLGHTVHVVRSIDQFKQLLATWLGEDAP